MKALALAGAAAGLVLAAAHPVHGAGAGDASTLHRGEQVYTRCAACHAIDRNRAGPQHCGLFGRRAGSAPGFEAYSPAMRDSGIVWDERTLDRFLADPLSMVPGTTMGYVGVKDARERIDLIAWLREATEPARACRPAP